MKDESEHRKFTMFDYRKGYENESRIMVLESETKGIAKTLDVIENNHLKHIQADIILIREWIAKNTPQSKLISKIGEYIAFLIVAAIIALIIKA